MKTFLFAIVITALFAAQASAGGFGMSIQMGGYRNHSPYGNPYYRPYGGYYSQPYYGNPYRGYYQPGHYDYHPTVIIPHGNHFHVQPGHLHYHQNSYWR